GNMKKSLNNFVIADPSKCIGCKACEVACFVVHNANNNVGYTVGTVTTPIIPRLNVIREGDFTMPIQCRHCEDAPCANSCTVGAIKQKDNIIFIEEKACIGCKICLLACPFGAIDLLPQYDNGKPVVQLTLEEDKKMGYKCDLCKDSEKPACIKACPKEALSLVEPFKEQKSKKIKAGLSLLEVFKNV
ncbi:MAG: 4Fe-4S dicluster domain-containing protein, partial [Thermotaleaceae bacterium]